MSRENLRGMRVKMNVTHQRERGQVNDGDSLAVLVGDESETGKTALLLSATSESKAAEQETPAGNSHDFHCRLPTDDSSRVRSMRCVPLFSCWIRSEERRVGKVCR